MPERASSLSRMTLRSESPSPGKNSSCCSTFEGNDDELGSSSSLISAESGYPNLLECLQASSAGKNKAMSPPTSGSEAGLYGFPLPAIPGLSIETQASNCSTRSSTCDSADMPNPSSGDCSEALSEVLSEVQMQPTSSGSEVGLYGFPFSCSQALSQPLCMESSKPTEHRLTAESTQALSESPCEKASLQSPVKHTAETQEALNAMAKLFSDAHEALSNARLLTAD